MKALTCEMCGSTDLIKQDGVFVCQACGTKYSVEEARKMMVEGTVEVRGAVRIDKSSEIDGLFQLAKRAQNTLNYDNAVKYYEQIQEIDPNNWEACYFASSCKAIKDKDFSVLVAIFPDAMKLIAAIENENEQSQAIQVFGDNVIKTAERLTDDEEPLMKDLYATIYSLIVDAAANSIDDTFNVKYSDTSVRLWKSALERSKRSSSYKATDETIVHTVKKIQKYEPDFVLASKSSAEQQTISDNNASNRSYGNSASNNSSGGCYIATAVYGSYNCPEVWTLRRYRDFALAETWYGRAFIKTYYAISPTMVRWFGNTDWFKKIWRGTLDRMVSGLRDQGFESTPYEDRVW